MLHAVKKVEYVKDYKLKLTFRNKDIKIVDLEKELIGPMFEPLKDINYFKQVKTDGYTIMWPNETDFCPDVLYEIGTEVKSAIKLAPKKPRRRTMTSSHGHKSSPPITAKSK